MRWLPRYLATIAVSVATCFAAPHLALGDRPEARALVQVGQELARIGERQEALEHFERAIRSDIDYVPAYEAALPLWLALGRWQEARSELETLTLRCKDCMFAWYALGALYRKVGRFDLAVLAYEAYLAKRPGDPDGHFGLAMAHAARKDAGAGAALARYLQLETRPERDAYRERALLMLREIGGPLETRVESRVKTAEPIPGIDLLIANGRLASAESLLNGSRRTDSVAIYWRTEIARGRGQWFHQLGYQALLRLYALR